jgi:hypothetical protein
VILVGGVLAACAVISVIVILITRKYGGTVKAGLIRAIKFTLSLLLVYQAIAQVTISLNKVQQGQAALPAILRGACPPVFNM